MLKCVYLCGMWNCMCCVYDKLMAWWTLRDPSSWQIQYTQCLNKKRTEELQEKRIERTCHDIMTMGIVLVQYVGSVFRLRYRLWHARQIKCWINKIITALKLRWANIGRLCMICALNVCNGIPCRSGSQMME